MSQDKVPNVRLNVAKAISDNSARLKKNESLKMSCTKLLQNLKVDDEDPDVIYFQKRGLRLLAEEEMVEEGPPSEEE